jgi:small subunit ribosomal protein S20
MPQHASAKKRVKTSERDRARNRGVKSHIRRAVQELQKDLAGDDVEARLRKVHSVLDKAAKKGVIPKQTAARRKARMSLAVNRGSAS